jgi:hypothetical protein
MNWKMATLGRRWRERAQYVHMEDARPGDGPTEGDDRTKTPTVSQLRAHHTKRNIVSLDYLGFDYRLIDRTVPLRTQRNIWKGVWSIILIRFYFWK